MIPLISFFKKRKDEEQQNPKITLDQIEEKKTEKVATRIGELGEYKIDIQLHQLPKDFKHLSDLLVENPKAKTGYSQLDHIVITPFGVFVIETKNYQGTIYGGKDRKTWSVNGKFKMMNPFIQNYGHIQALKTSLIKNTIIYLFQWFPLRNAARLKLMTSNLEKLLLMT